MFTMRGKTHNCCGLCTSGRSRGRWETIVRGNVVPRVLVFALAFLISAAVVIRCDSDGFCGGRGFSRGFARTPGFPSIYYHIGIFDVSGGRSCPVDG